MSRRFRKGPPKARGQAPSTGGLNTLRPGNHHLRDDNPHGVDGSQITSGTSLDGQPLVADGAGGSEWAPVPDPITDKFWAFGTAGAGGIRFFGGFYMYSGTDSDFSAQQTMGTADASYAAHAFVILGATTVDELIIRVAGTSINDKAERVASDYQDIVIPAGAVAGAYYETPKKWLGQVTLDHQGGTAKTCNWGYSKYWDRNNTNFRVIGLEATWVGGGNDNTPEIQLIHHKADGWTFNAGADPTFPTAIAGMNADHTTEIKVKNGENGAWKRSTLNVDVMGAESEGTLWCVTSNGANTFETGTLQLVISAL